jgi:NADPH-dependent 2,4-dienoyl-CoA reductase/sulfur reductase-like enzyme/Fe-S-cluster-containing hydrogenase component 2
MNKTIVVDIKKCLACRSCEIACALEHSRSKVLEEAIAESPKPQRMVTVEAAGEFGAPMQCRHCIDACCIEICPTGAIRKQSEPGPVIIDQQLCIGCKLCMLICPFGVLQIGAKGRAIIKCDMCYERAKEGELPACVEACPTKSLKMVLLEAVNQSEQEVSSKQPQSKNKIQKHSTGKKIVVIGSSAAGMTAAIAAAKEKSDAEVKVVTSDRIPYRRPAIPALIAGNITGPEGAEIFTNDILTLYNIELIRSTKAIGIDPESKTIFIKSDGKEKRLLYDAAIIATGGQPLIAQIIGSDKKGVCTFTTFEAAAEIVEMAKGAGSAVVVGAGFIALEIAESLMHKGLEVYFNVRSRILRKLLEPELSEFISQRFQRQGLKMLTGESISEIGGNGQVEYVIHKGQRIATNLVVMGTGVKPNVSLAEKCGIKLGVSGAIKVDNRMQSSIEDIYAVGDCAQSPDLNKKTAGFLRAQADEIFGLQIFSIGHSSTTAKEVGLSVDVYDLTVPESTIRNQRVNLFERGKILIDSNDRIVGGQLIAEKYGSQFACQLYKAVLESQKREEFLEKFNLSGRETVQTLIQYEL